MGAQPLPWSSETYNFQRVFLKRNTIILEQEQYTLEQEHYILEQEHLY